LDTGPSGYKVGIVELRHAFDNQTHTGTSAGIGKLIGMALIPFGEQSDAISKLSSRLSQTQI
jgi:hypothetical protein